MRKHVSSCGSEYRYKHVTSSILLDDLSFSDDAACAGDSLPDFTLRTTADTTVRRSDMLGKPLLLFTGSLSCPMTASSNQFLRRLHRCFGDRISFLMVYVREAHPGEFCPQPRTMDQKLQAARRLKDRDSLPWVVAADDLDGSVHRALDVRPNVAYLANSDGRIIFRALCAGDRKGIGDALESVVRGHAPPSASSSNRLIPMAEGIGNLRWITRASGPQAVRDVWRAVPPVAAVGWLAAAYRPLSAKWRTFAAVATLALASYRVLRLRNGGRRL